jgi:hypothetical protein
MQVPVVETPWQGKFPDLPNWSENYCLAAFDPKCGVGIWLHMGRWRKDLTLWREIVTIRLPDGRVVAHRAIGNARAAADGPGGPAYAIRVVESGQRLTYHFVAGARVVPALEMRAGLIGEGVREPVSFELAFDSKADIWDLHKVGDRQEFLPAGHIEQIGRVNGTIRVGDRTYDFDTFGNRDHSLGPRDNKALHSHQWLHGIFEDGTAFLLFDAVQRNEDKPVFSEAVVYKGDRLHQARLEMGWRCDDVSLAEKTISFSLISDMGRHDVESTAYRGNSYLSFTSPNDLYVGVYPAGDPPLTLLEQSVDLRLNGSVRGYGCFERTVPGVLAAES